jgi:hypothetical protein
MTLYETNVKMEAVSFKPLKKYVTSIALGSYGVDDRGNVLYFRHARLQAKILR